MGSDYAPTIQEINEGTLHPPSSDEKLSVMEARRDLGLPLFHADDATYYAPSNRHAQPYVPRRAIIQDSLLPREREDPRLLDLWEGDANWHRSIAREVERTGDRGGDL